MTHISEQDLVLYFYGDSERSSEIAAHLQRCPECSREFAQLSSTLQAIEYPVPDRDSSYEAQLWSTLRPRLAEEDAHQWSRWSWLLQPRRWAVAGALAAVLIATFFAGRYTKPTQSPGPQVATNQPVAGGADRVLLVAVGDHLNKTEMILVGIMNAQPEGKIDISAERDAAQQLAEENRLYRVSAQRQKDPKIASLLEQLEPVLVDIAHHPDSVSADNLRELQERIKAQGVLFDVRVVASQVLSRSHTEMKKAEAPTNSI